MNKDNLISILQKNSLAYKDKLTSFFIEYVEYLEKLNAYILSPECSDKEKYIVKKLESWMFDEGYELIINTIGQLDDSVETKMIKFIELYEFFLSCSSNSVEKMVDHLFYIPGQFFSQFMSRNRSLVGTIEEVEPNVLKSSITNYTVIKMGVFQEIPFFDKWRVC